MTITKEYLEIKIKNLQQQRDQALANANAFLGAIQGFQLLVQELEIEEKAANDSAKSEGENNS